jgi:PAS domain S-box-containing protein
VELLAAHQRLQELFDNAVVMICAFDPQGRFVLVNAASVAVLGYQPEELIGTHFAPLILEEDLPRAEQEAAKVFGGGQTTDYELRFRRKDGEVVDLSWSSYWSARDQRVYGVARDVTARKRRDLLLAGQQQALAGIVRGVPARHTMDELSALVQALVREARTSVMRVESGRLHTVASRGLDPAWNQAMDGLPIGPDSGVCGVVALSGTQRVVSDVADDPNCAAYAGLAAAHGIRACWSVPLAGGDGAVLGTFALYFPTQRAPQGEELELLNGAAQVASLAFERERLDAVLQRTARRLHDAAHVAQLGHWELDLVTSGLHWSDEVFDIFGLTRTGFGADYQAFLHRVHPDDRAGLQAAQDAVLAGGPALDVAHRIVCDDGTVRWVHERALLERDAEGRPVSLVGTVQDVTAVVNLRHALEETRAAALAESQRLNAELEARVVARTAELEAANKELETFAYSVSHDLRAPLRAIAGFSDILLREHAAQLDDQGQRFLQRVVAATERMGRLIDDLLDLSRVARLAPERRPVDLSALATRLLEERAEHEPERRVEWQVEADLLVDADPRLLEIALENLLGNAWKFTRDRQPAHIRVWRERAPDGTPVYTIDDDGAGFDPRYAERLFGVFQRLHNDSEFPGTGIGLATVQRVIHRHGGRVWAEGRPGAGCTIRFTLG